MITTYCNYGFMIMIKDDFDEMFEMTDKRSNHEE
jgi:hypothetical protein